MRLNAACSHPASPFTFLGSCGDNQETMSTVCCAVCQMACVASHQNQRQRRGQPVAVRDNRQAPVESSPPLRTPAATRLACAPDLEDHFYDRRYTTTTTIYGPRLHANAALHKCKPSSNKVCGDGNRPAAGYAERSPPMELPPALTPAPLSSPRWPRAAGPPPCRHKPCQLLNRRQFPMPTS